MMYSSYGTLTAQIKGQQETGQFFGLCDQLISLMPNSGGHIKGTVVYSEIQHVPEAVLFHSNGCGSSMVHVKFSPKILGITELSYAFKYPDQVL